jgi:hypothetical protein
MREKVPPALDAALLAGGVMRRADLGVTER